MQWRTARYVASLILMGLGVSEALSQQTQGREEVQTPRAEILLTELSDLRRRAEEGDSKAQYGLGRFYMVGLGVSQDYQQAAKWYEHAAEQGFAEAQFMMGFLYEHGKGVRRDYTRALEYYRAAADQGHTTAANNLATLYLHGLVRRPEKYWYSSQVVSVLSRTWRCRRPMQSGDSLL
jgi:TPR repeat protein